jgi:hypothetical protein
LLSLEAPGYSELLHISRLDDLRPDVPKTSITTLRFSILGGQAIDTSGTSTRSGNPKDAPEKPDKSEMKEEEDED